MCIIIGEVLNTPSNFTTWDCDATLLHLWLNGMPNWDEKTSNEQRDQMARLVFLHLAIFNNESTPLWQKILPKRLFKFWQCGEILPNLVTLLMRYDSMRTVAQFRFHQNEISPFCRVPTSLVMKCGADNLSSSETRLLEYSSLFGYLQQF